MGKVKDSIIEAQDREQSQLERDHAAACRRYSINDVIVTRDVYIMKMALALYNDNCSSNNFKNLIENQVDYYGSASTSLIANDYNFMTKHIEPDVVEPRPIKKYTVSYDIVVVPSLTSLRGHGKAWKRVQETTEATNFKEAKDNVRGRLHAEHREVKSFEVYEYVEVNPDETKE